MTTETTTATTTTDIPEIINWRHYGALRMCLYFGSCDIGVGEIERADGVGTTEVFTTWGRNLTEEQARQWASKLAGGPVCTGAFWDDGMKRATYELVFPASEITRLKDSGALMLDMSYVVQTLAKGEPAENAHAERHELLLGACEACVDEADDEHESWIEVQDQVGEVLDTIGAADAAMLLEDEEETP